MSSPSSVMALGTVLPPTSVPPPLSWLLGKQALSLQTYGPLMALSPGLPVCRSGMLTLMMSEDGLFHVPGNK